MDHVAVDLCDSGASVAGRDPCGGGEVYRIGDEAIRDIWTHAGGTRLDVSLNYAADLVERVKDNGVSIDATLAEKGSAARVRSFSKCSESRKSFGK